MSASLNASERGSILPLIAVGMSVFIGMLGLAVDVGNMVTARDQLKNAADAAAKAAASALSNPNGGSGAVPNLVLAESTAASALSNLQNASDGVSIMTASDITAGGWDLTGAQTTIQPWIQGSGLTPAVEVILQKSGANGLVRSFFSKVFGYNGFSATVRSVAIGNFSPATAEPKQLLPLALSQCVYDQFWDFSTQQPKRATVTTPLCSGCPEQTVGQPFVIRIGSDWGSNVILGETTASCPATGIWTTFTTGSNADSVVSQFMTGYDKTLSLGESIWLYQTQGAKANLYNVLKNLGLPLGALMPVVTGNATPGSWTPVYAYACVKVLASEGGNSKSIDLQLLPASNQPVSTVQNQGFNCLMRGSGTSEKTFVIAPPLLVN